MKHSDSSSNHSNQDMGSASSPHLDQLLQEMWQDYCLMNPNAQAIHKAFVAQGEVVENDHIALRTLNLKHINIGVLAKTFLGFGYLHKGDYEFTEKKLKAQHFEHADPSKPKIFISELELEKISPWARETLTGLAQQIPASALTSPRLTMAGRLWKATHEVYEKLAAESEYAAWWSAFGFRPNHFTVNVNTLKKFPTLPQVNSFIEKLGHHLNSSGGVIKGSKEVLLEQSSTMAELVPVKFDDGTFQIPGCYYEFALRYALPNGKLYQGFVAASADKIFESTNRLS